MDECLTKVSWGICKLGDKRFAKHTHSSLNMTRFRYVKFQGQGNFIAPSHGSPLISLERLSIWRTQGTRDTFETHSMRLSRKNWGPLVWQFRTKKLVKGGLVQYPNMWTRGCRWVQGQGISKVCHMVPPPSKVQGHEHEGEKNRKVP